MYISKWIKSLKTRQNRFAKIKTFEVETFREEEIASEMMKSSEKV